MTLIDIDKFIASFIEVLKEFHPTTVESLPFFIKKALEDQGLEYKDKEIVKTQRRVSAEAKENGYGESEDERIRGAIIDHLKDYNLTEWAAWLEKQEGCEYIKKDWLEHIKQSWYKEGFIDGKYNGGTSKEWTINDAATLKELIDFLENGTAKLQHDLTRYANWLKIQFTPIEKQGQKPAWSEKDENGLGDALWCCKQAASIAKDENDMGNAWHAEHWLKSLKQRYTWKPSGLQIEALEDAIKFLGCTRIVRERLKSLYEQLKKLK